MAQGDRNQIEAEQRGEVALAVISLDDASRPRAVDLARTLNAVLLESNEVGEECDVLLEVSGKGLAARALSTNDIGLVRVDFLGGALGHRLRRGVGKTLPLARALGFKGAPLRVIDATLGLGRDAFLLATLGCDVIALERSAVLLELVHDGLQRACATDAGTSGTSPGNGGRDARPTGEVTRAPRANDGRDTHPTAEGNSESSRNDGRDARPAREETRAPRVRGGQQARHTMSMRTQSVSEAAARVELHHADAMHWLSTQGPKQAADAIYLDPMFPARRRESALVKKEMRLIHLLAGRHDPAQDQTLLEAARASGAKRIAVKRYGGAPPIAAGANHIIRAGSVRYDVYLHTAGA